MRGFLEDSWVQCLAPLNRTSGDVRLHTYRPPPAQAQAQPAQAQAHAQPPLLPPLLVPDEGLGGGLVELVTFSVKVFTLPSTFCEKVCTPVTIWAAKSAPGRAVEGALMPGNPEEGFGVEEAGRNVGS